MTRFGMEQLVGVICIQVPVDCQRGTGESTAVDNTGVVSCVAQDHVTRPGKCGDRAGVGSEAGREKKGRLGLFKTSKLAFKLLMKFRPTGDKRAGTTSPSVDQPVRVC